MRIREYKNITIIFSSLSIFPSSHHVVLSINAAAPTLLVYTSRPPFGSPIRQAIRTISYIATTATIAAPKTPTTDPMNVIAPPVNGVIDGEADPVDTVIAPVPLGALIIALDSDAGAVVDGAADGVTELIDTETIALLDTAAVEVVPDAVVLAAAAVVVDTGAAAVEVDTGAADVAVAAQEHTEATAVMTSTPVAAPQADRTQPSAEAWMAAEEAHWQW